MTRDEKLLSYLRATDQSLAKRRIDVYWDNGKDTAYTVDNRIGINPESELVTGCEYPEVCIIGLNAHEILHVLLTASDMRDKLISGLNGPEKHLFTILSNVVEDQAIENFASTQFGGMLIDSLTYMIAETYRGADKVENKKPLAEYVNSVITFGNGGFLKKDFAFEKAKTAFLKTVKEIFSISWDGNAKRRMERCLALCNDPYVKALLEDDPDPMDSIQSALNDLQKQGKSITNPSSSGKDLSEQAESNELRNEKSEAEKSLDKQLEDVADKADEASSADSKSRDKGQDAKQDGDAKDGNGSSDKTGEASADSISEAMERAKERIEAARKAAARINSELDRFVNDKRETKDQEETESYDYARPQLEDLKKEFRKVPIQNILEKPRVDEYRKTLYPLKRTVSVFAKRIQKIFEMDQDELEPSATSGKVDPFRHQSPARHRKILKKAFECTEKSETAIQIAVDCSGSTVERYKGKRYIDYEKEAAIIVAEALSKFKSVKVNVTGFCYSGDKVVHHHALNWHNTEQNRSRILGFAPNGRNFDSFSMNTLKEELKRQKKEHNLMVVILDGLPNCPYSSGKPGIEDNRQAVAAAEADGIKVVGIGIGDVDEKAFRKMFGANCCIINDLGELGNKVTKVITETVNGW